MRPRVGDKIWFKGERQGYTVQACNGRYSVCTKPFNPKKTVLYTVIDHQEEVRGTENLIFGFGAETRQQCEEMLERIRKQETEISHRNFVALDITKWQRGKRNA